MVDRAAGTVTLVTISRRAEQVILADAARRAPTEACGLLVGGGRHVAEAVPTPNRSPHPHRFLIDPVDLHRVVSAAEVDGRDIVGVFHSHPAGPPVPSKIDLRSPLDSRWVNVIAAPSAGGWGIRAFHIEGGQARELTLHREAAPAGLR